jgi:hypothetical protein
MVHSIVGIVLAVVLCFALVAPVTAQSPTRPDAVRHSGRIVEVAPDGSAIVVEELLTWSGPGTGVVTRSIRLTPRTAIDVIQRADGWDGDRAALPGWDTRVIDAADLRRGDFVTVTTDGDRRAVAVALQVVRPATQ